MTECLADTAYKYADEYGFSILSLKPRSKKPSTENGLNDATNDAEFLREWFTEHPDNNLAVACGKPSGGIVVVDIDIDCDEGYDGWETLIDWEQEHGELPETVSVKTGRGGYHLYYRADRPIKPSVNNEVHVDIRGDGSYAMLPPSIHPNGTRICWENDPDEYEIADADENVYAFIDHVRPAKKEERKKHQPPKEIKKGERNDTLYRQGCSMRAQEYDDNYITSVLEVTNDMLCKPPLPKDELDRIIDSVLKLEPGLSEEAKEAQQKSAKTSKFRKSGNGGKGTGAIKHDAVGKELIEKYKAGKLGKDSGAPVVFRNGHYESGWAAVDKTVRDLVDDCKINDQREIRGYIKDKAPVIQEAPPEYIAFRNCVLHIYDGVVEDADDIIIPSVIPHDYNPDAYCELADKTLDRMSNNDPVIRDNLEEIIGMCMFRTNKMGQCPILIGSGSNGKSTFILMLRNALGNENVSSIEIGSIGKQFQAVSLLGKLANLSDDISNARLESGVLSVIKKITSGEWIHTDNKYAEGFDFNPYCTIVISCNEFPTLEDKTYGMMRRLFPIPFDAKFSRGDKGFDPRLHEKLSTEEAAQYLINIGLQGLQRVIYNSGFTPNRKSEELLHSIETDNDNVLQWIENYGYDGEYFSEKIIKDQYERYKDWCYSTGAHPYTQYNFTRNINGRFGFKSASTKRLLIVDGVEERVDIRVFRKKKV